MAALPWRSLSAVRPARIDSNNSARLPAIQDRVRFDKTEILPP
jgi:hypothetical protein